MGTTYRCYVATVFQSGFGMCLNMAEVLQGVTDSFGENFGFWRSLLPRNGRDYTDNKAKAAWCVAESPAASTVPPEASPKGSPRQLVITPPAPSTIGTSAQ